MKIHITKAGRGLVACFIIGIVIFFICGGTAVIAKILEEHRVNSLPLIANVFSNSDISYNNWSSLKNSFTSQYTEIWNYLQKANELKKSYPKNNVLANKIQNYNAYLNSMAEASFVCPEHINTGVKPRYQNCYKCNGSGKHGWFFQCKECKGRGKIYYNVKIKQNCPHCGTIGKSPIHGKSLLNR